MRSSLTPSPLMGLLALLATLLPSTSSLFAHHVNDGELPGNFTEGLLSGLAHPVIGPDHLAFIIAVGLLAFIVKQPIRLPLFFVVGALIGCFMHLGSIDIPMLEPMIASTVIIFGAVVAFRAFGSDGSFWLPAALVAGTFHGYAYAEAIIGSVNSALSAYLIGFTVVQFVVAHSVARLASTVPVIGEHASKIGFALSAVGTYFLYSAL